MKERSLLYWLYADIDEVIDFDGYNEPKEDSDNEREQSIKTCSNNGGPIRDDNR